MFRITKKHGEKVAGKHPPGHRNGKKHGDVLEELWRSIRISTVGGYNEI